MAGYCKKLEKLGFVDIQTQRNSSERVVKLTSMATYWEQIKDKGRGKKDNKKLVHDADFEQILDIFEGQGIKPQIVQPLAMLELGTEVQSAANLPEREYHEMVHE